MEVVVRGGGGRMVCFQRLGNHLNAYYYLLDHKLIKFHEVNLTML